jgi:hypothetical protein
LTQGGALWATARCSSKSKTWLTVDGSPATAKSTFWPVTSPMGGRSREILESS